MDLLDRVREYLRGIVPQDILEPVILAVRSEYGGSSVYVRSPAAERCGRIRAALSTGQPIKTIAALHGITRQAVYYHKANGAQ